MKVISSALVAIILLLFTSSVFAQDSERGKILYEAYCVACHGFKGKGDGLSAPVLIPKPKDFSELDSKGLLTKEKVFGAIANGTPKTQMEGWKQKFSSEDIAAIAEYILLLR